MLGQASFITLTSKTPCLCTQLNAMECSRLVETSAFTLIASVAVFWRLWYYSTRYYTTRLALALSGSCSCHLQSEIFLIVFLSQFLSSLHPKTFDMQPCSNHIVPRIDQIVPLLHAGHFYYSLHPRPHTDWHLLDLNSTVDNQQLLGLAWTLSGSDWFGWWTYCNLLCLFGLGQVTCHKVSSGHSSKTAASPCKLWITLGTTLWYSLPRLQDQRLK